MRGFTGHAFLLLLGFAVATIQGCNGHNLVSGLSKANSPRSLPELSQLDRLVSSESTTTRHADLAMPVIEENTSGTDGFLSMSAPENELAYAVFAFEPAEEEELLSMKAEGHHNVWLLVADYSTGRWSKQTQLGTITTQINLDGEKDWTSPSGKVYAAVMVGPETPGNVEDLWLETFAPGHEPATLYVSVEGDDANDGGETAPWETLQHAVNQLLPGDTLIVKPGEYAGFMTSLVGTAEQPVTIEAEDGARITREASTLPSGIILNNSAHITITGFTITGRFQNSMECRDSNYIIISDFECSHSEIASVSLNYCNNVQIVNSHLHDSTLGVGLIIDENCLSVEVKDNLITNNLKGSLVSKAKGSPEAPSIFSENISMNNGQMASNSCLLLGIEHYHIQNNLFKENVRSISIGRSGLGLESQGTLIANNTFLGGQSANSCIRLLEGCGDVSVYNNIMCSTSVLATYEMHEDLVPLLVSDHNCMTDKVKVGLDSFSLEDWRMMNGQDLNSHAVTPLTVFVDAEAEDYRPAGPALDMGLEQFAPAIDLSGNPRPFGLGYDCGCYELLENISD